MSIEELKKRIKETKEDIKFYLKENEDKFINKVLSNDNNEEPFNVGYYSALQDIENLLK